MYVLHSQVHPKKFISVKPAQAFKDKLLNPPAIEVFNQIHHFIAKSQKIPMVCTIDVTVNGSAIGKNDKFNIHLFSQIKIHLRLL